MLGLVLIHLLTWATLVVLFWAGAAWFQGLIYSEPASQFYWRAPAAAAILTLWLGFWSTREYWSYLADHQGRPTANLGSRYGAVFEFSPFDDHAFDEFWVKDGEKKVRYMKRTVFQGNRPGHPEFVMQLPASPDPRVEPIVSQVRWTRTDEVILKENGQEVIYTVERDKNGQVKEEKPAVGTASGSGARYRSDRGKVITEDMIRRGQITSFRWGAFGTYFLLNAGFLLLWFAGMWLLLRFQWSHALGLAIVCWALAIIFVIPALVGKVDGVAESKAATAAASTSQRLERPVTMVAI